MVWCSILYAGKAHLAILNENIDSRRYVDILKNYLLPHAYPHLALFFFQQDNASVHTSTSVKQWLDVFEISTVDWSARSPDFSPIENGWSHLSRTIYDMEENTIV